MVSMWVGWCSVVLEHHFHLVKIKPLPNEHWVFTMKRKGIHGQLSYIGKGLKACMNPSNTFYSLSTVEIIVLTDVNDVVTNTALTSSPS